MKILRSVKSFEINSRKRTRSCISCSNLAKNIASYEFEGITIEEKYCDTCAALLGMPTIK